MITRSRTALVIGLAALAAVSGCASGKGHGAAATAAKVATPSASATPSQTPTASAAQLGKTLETMALKRADLPSGMKIGLVPAGDVVKGQVTLDNCGYDFTTEADRVARRQYDVTDGGQDTGLMNELVAYDSAADAAKALSQWHAAAAHCPHGLIHSHVASEGTYTEKIVHNTLGESDLPVSHSAVTEMEMTQKGEGSFYNITIVQVQGRFLDNIYLNTQKSPTKYDWAAARQFADVTGGRLAGLASATV